MVVREMIATARERIAKFREAEKMVGARGGAERQRERASSTHSAPPASLESTLGDGYVELWEGDFCPFFHAPVLKRGGI